MGRISPYMGGVMVTKWRRNAIEEWFNILKARLKDGELHLYWRREFLDGVRRLIRKIE
ncbi:MAG: hypothetical protein J7K95_06050 [Thermoplasmata archaeon]|nr:hypothetical protein [Thermoplasmata archaeon]